MNGEGLIHAPPNFLRFSSALVKENKCPFGALQTDFLVLRKQIQQLLIEEFSHRCLVEARKHETLRKLRVFGKVNVLHAQSCTNPVEKPFRSQRERWQFQSIRFESYYRLPMSLGILPTTNRVLIVEHGETQAVCFRCHHMMDLATMTLVEQREFLHAFHQIVILRCRKLQSELRRYSLQSISSFFLGKMNQPDNESGH